MEVPLSTDLPPATEPPAHTAYAANPTPNYAPNFNHPPYAEMITAAIVAMKEKDGSSRQAIARYIENEYKNLSPAHPTLLTQQLKRMKNNGQLVTVKHSYMLPRSVPLPLSTTGNNITASSGSTNSVFTTNSQASDSSKRRPGRPPKATPEIQPNGVGVPENGFFSAGAGTGPQNIGPQFGFVGGPSSTGPQFGFAGPQTIDPGQFGGPLTGFSAFGQVGGPVTSFSQFGQVSGALNTFPTFGQQVGGLTSTGPTLFGQQVGGLSGPTFDPVEAVPTVVPIAHVDGLSPAKRRGRPPKVKFVEVGAEPVGPLVVSLGLVDGLQSTVTKRRGRPPKVNNGPRPIVQRVKGRPRLLPVMNGGVQKRGRGRPPIGGQRPRGQPRKGVVSTVGLTGKPRGRPRKNVALNGVGALGSVDGASRGGGVLPVGSVDGAGGGGGGVLPVKRAGRPPNMGVAKKPRKLSGKPLGRPKKNASVAAIQASEQQQQLMAYQELKARVEHFQSRIKQAVSVVKPYLNTETAVIAVGALQELEELASLDISTPPVTVQSAPLAVQTAPLTDQSAPLTVQSEPVAVQGVEPLLQN